jgi:hypothetical protein
VIGSLAQSGAVNNMIPITRKLGRYHGRAAMQDCSLFRLPTAKENRTDEQLKAFRPG